MLSPKAIVEIIKHVFDDDQFEEICGAFLRDQGYTRIRRGKLEGPDGGFDWEAWTDESGTGGRVGAHCNTFGSNVKQKLVQDAARGASADDKSNVSRKEILFFSASRVLLTLEDERKNTENKIIPAIRWADTVGAYAHALPTIRYYSSENIAETIHLDRDSHTRAIFYKYVRDHFIDFQEHGPSNDVDTNRERDLERCLLDATGRGVGLDDPGGLSEILELIMLVLRRNRGEYFLREHPTWEKHRYAPILSLALSLPRSSAPEIGSRLSAAIDFLAPLVDQSHHSTCLFLARTIHRVLYDHYAAFEISDTAIAKVQDLANRDDSFWELFALDIQYRAHCFFLRLPEALSSSISKAGARYCAKHPSKPLARLRGLLLTPSRNVTRDLGSLVKQFCLIGSDCETNVEARWCLGALTRLLPLFQEELEDDPVLTVCGAMRDRVFRDSTSATYVYLRRLLICAQKTARTRNMGKRRTVGDLVLEYEHGFQRWSDSLPGPDRMMLQMQYSAVLYSACRSSEDLGLRKTRFAGYLRDEENTNLFAKSLFFCPDPIVKSAMSTTPGPKTHTDIAISGWLERYGRKLFERCCRSPHGWPHIRLLELRSAAAFPSIVREGCFTDPIKGSLEACRSFLSEAAPGFAARSCWALHFFSRAHYPELALDYVERAVEADDYDVEVAAPYIGEALFGIYYFADHTVFRRRVERISRAWKEKCGIGEAGVPPRGYWVYLAGIQFADRPLEGQFLSSLAKACNQPGGYVTSDTGITFSDGIVELVRASATQGSLFALALSERIQDPEIWNIAGTTVIECHTSVGELASAARMAAQFYRFAVTWAKASGERYQKVSYNWIYAEGTALLGERSAEVPDIESYVSTALDFLCSARADQFPPSYKLERIESFLRIVGENWAELGSGVRDRFEVLHKAKSKKWIVEHLDEWKKSVQSVS